LGRQQWLDLADSTDVPADKIVSALLGDAKAVWVRDVEKAGEVAVKAAQNLKRSGSHIISDAEATKQCKEHKQDCDLCSSACPLSLPVSKAVRQLAGDWKDGEVERGRNPRQVRRSLSGAVQLVYMWRPRGNRLARTSS
jgi:CO dehydrogenase/acetyl-CoA synthase alpha subunit